MNNDDKHWHLDRKVPIALIVAIAIQTGTGIWWAAGVNTRVEQLERQTNNTAPQAERIVRLETKMDGIFASLAEIKQLLQRNVR